jgi:hypothetical protein
VSKQSATEFLFGVAVCALLLQTLETFQLAREIFWFGTSTTGEGTVALGFLTYAFLVFIVSAIPAAFLVILGRRAETIPVSVPVYIVTAILAVVLVRNTELGFARPELLFVIVVVATGLFGGCGALRFDQAWQRAAAAIIVVSLLAAVAAIHEIKYAATLFKLQPSVTVYLATATGLLVYIHGWRAWLRTRDRATRWTTTVRIAAVALIVPFAARAFADYRGVFSAEEGPRVLLLTADTLRADYLSLYGGEVPTPNLDRLGEQGVTFENAYALSSWTPPSLAGMFSSQYPPSTSADADLDQWRKDFTTGFISLADYWTSAQGRSFIGDLRGIGIRTAMVLANTVMMGHQWLVDDFEFIYSVNHQTEGQRDGPFRHLPLLHRRIEAVAPGFAPHREFDSSAPTRDLARIHLRQLRHEPFFLWVHFLDPHSPYAPPEQYIPSEVEERIYPPGARSAARWARIGIRIRYPRRASTREKSATWTIASAISSTNLEGQGWTSQPSSALPRTTARSSGNTARGVTASRCTKNSFASRSSLKAPALPNAVSRRRCPRFMSFPRSRDGWASPNAHIGAAKTFARSSRIPQPPCSNYPFIRVQPLVSKAAVNRSKASSSAATN